MRFRDVVGISDSFGVGEIEFFAVASGEHTKESGQFIDTLQAADLAGVAFHDAVQVVVHPGCGGVPADRTALLDNHRHGSFQVVRTPECLCDR